MECRQGMLAAGVQRSALIQLTGKISQSSAIFWMLSPPPVAAGPWSTSLLVPDAQACLCPHRLTTPLSRTLPAP